MEFFKKQTKIDFLGGRRVPMILSVFLVAATIVSLVVNGLNFGLDFTGGTLVEINYSEPAEITQVRQNLEASGIGDAVVQHFGTTRDVLVRLPVTEDKNSVALSNEVIEALRRAAGERFVSAEADKTQLCMMEGGTEPEPCRLQVQRVEFVGPQIGGELAYNGGLALLYTLIAILIYVMFRFEWRFSVGSVIATAHDVLLTFGFFSLTQMEFSLSVLAAILAVLGYSLNDTIVIFDRIRENFRKMRKSNVMEILNTSVNQTISRTIITSGTTLMVLLSLFFFGGEIIHGFSVALIVGIIAGTYSSIYIATPAVLALGVSREDMLPVKKEGAEQQDLNP